MSDLILTTSGITKSFKRFKAVDNVDLHIEKGAIYGFIGRNGAGKTTFLKMIAGLSSPTSGKIEHSIPKEKIGCLIENPGLYPNMTAYTNLAIKCRAFGITDESYIKDLLELVGLSDTGKKKTKQFSLGMKQRLGIAMALVGEPELLLLDEPINGLDPQGIIEVRETILKLNKERGITIMISSHILEELSKIATHYGIIEKGELIQELTSDELFSLCNDGVTINVDDVKKAEEVLKSMDVTDYKVSEDSNIVVNGNVENSAKINRALVTAGVEVSEIYVRGQQLEQYFVELTGGGMNA